MGRLTKRVVDGAEPREKPYTLWCSELKGFGIRVAASGKKAYLVDYRTAGGERRRMNLGVHGVVTTEQARKLALDSLGGVVRGEDPQLEKRTRRKSLTMSDLCQRYLDAAERGLILGKGGSPKKASTMATDRGRIEQHIKPLMGRMLVMDVKRADVQRFVRDVQAGKTAKKEPSGRKQGVTDVRGGAGTATRTTGLLGAILSYAVSEGVIEFNPAHGVKRPSYNRNARRLTMEEYARLGAALREAADEGERDQVIDATRLIVLTGLRRGEALGLTWDEVDFDGRCVRLKDSKEGRSIRPIGSAALAVLKDIRDRVDSPFVIPAPRGEGAFAGYPAAWQRLAKRASLDDVTPHTLRHGFGSVAGDLGLSEPTIAALLGHAAGTVTSRYVHHLDEVLIAAADRVSEAIAAAMK